MLAPSQAEASVHSSSFGRALRRIVVTLSLIVGSVSPGLAQVSIDAGGVATSEGRHVLLSVPSDVGGNPVIAIEIDVAGPAEIGHVPDGWEFESSDGGFRLGGTPLGEDKGKFRLDIPEDVMWDGARFRLLGADGELWVGRVDPPSEYPDLEVNSDVSTFVLAPDKASAGEIVRMEIKDEDLVGVGNWLLEGVRVQAAGDTKFLTGRIPLALQAGDFAGLTYEDAFGLETISDEEAIEITGSSDDDDREPALTGCTPQVFRGRTACVCGYFPTTEIQGGLMLDGQPIGTPNAASSEVVYIEIPDATAPGKHTITGNGIDGSIEIIVLAARGEIDMERIQQGGSTPLRVIVEGTDEPLQLILRNLAPDIIELEGGVEQQVETTGGDVNSFERTVRGLAPGAFDVYYELAEDACPCVQSDGVDVASNDPGGTRERNPQDSTVTRPPWWPEDPEGDDPRDVPIPPIYGEEEDGEDSGCCGFRGPLLVWPQTSDPIAPSAPMLAPHAPAVAGVQVHLANGAYFQNDRDLTQEAIGIPFDLVRHYTSDVQTLSGGFIGERWDFSYNKRLVALGRDYADGLRGQLVGTEKSVVMYFDGMGRALRYVESDSDWRYVLNFGARSQFHAYVTTYQSPDGEFNELQRYVLEDPSQHPFAGHTDIDKGEAIFFVLREKNGVRYIFNCRGQLLHILGRNDFASLPGTNSREPVRYTFKYRGPRNPLTQNTTLSSIEDPSGRSYYFSTKDIDKAPVNTNDDCFHVTGNLPIPRVRKIFGPGIEITYKYADGDKKPILETVRRVFKVSGMDSVVTETRYSYDGEQRLTAVVAPEQVANRGKPYIRNEYDGAGRIKSQWLAGKLHSTFAYQGSSVTVTSGTGPITTYGLTRIGEYQVVQTEAIAGGGKSWTTRYDHNKATQVTSTTLPRGNRIVYLYDGGNESVVKGPMRNDVEAGVTYHNNLSLGNLIGVRRERGTLPAGDGPDFIATATEYEPLYNQASRVADANGNATTFTYEYDDQGLLGNPVEEKPPTLTQPDGSTATIFPRTFSYTPKGLTESEAETPFDVTDYVYDEAGDLTEVKSVHGNQTFVRDFFGRVRRTTGKDGKIEYVRDARGLTTEELRDNGSRTKYEYDLNGNLVKETRQVQDDFGESETLIGTIAAPRPVARFDRVTKTERDVLGRPVGETVEANGLTRVTKRVFDEAGRVERTEEPSPTGGALTTTYEFDGRGNITVEKHGSFETRRTYDENGNLLTVAKGPKGLERKQAYAYDPFDRAVSETDPIGTVTLRTLDAKGNVLSEEVRGSNGDQEATTATLEKTETTYNEHDLVKTRTTHVLDAAKTTKEEQFFYNRIAKLTKQIEPGDVVTQYGYDQAGRLKEMVDPVGNKTVYEYGDFDRQESVTQVEIERSYKPETRAWTQSTKEYKTTFTYDKLGRITRTVAPEAETAYRYNSDGMRRLAALSGVGLSETQYDGLGRQSKVVTGGEEQTFAYTPAGQVSEQKSATQHLRFTFDDQGNTVETEDVLLGARTIIKRDGVGNPVEITDANGTKTFRTFNELGLPLVDRIQWGQTRVQSGELNLSTVGGPGTLWRRYDGLGRLRYAQNGYDATTRDAGVSLRYDGLGRIIREEQSSERYGQTIDRTFAADDSWMETRYPEVAGSAKVRRHYDKLGRVIRVDLDGEMVASYGYSGSDRIAGQSLRNGVVSVYSYDDKRRMTEERIYREAGDFSSYPEIIYTARATYGASGRLKEMLAVDQSRSTSTTTTYTYDRRGRTTESVSTSSVGGSTPSQTVSRMMTEYDGNRPSVQAELLTQTQGEFPVAQFARIQEFTYDGVRVSSVKTTARDQFRGRVPEIAGVDDLKQWIAGDGSFTDTQKFVYDPVGNIVADDANLYRYDYERRLIAVIQIPGNRPYNQSTSFKYDPLGRRTEVIPIRDRTPRGFVDFDPWTRTEAWFLYDGQTVIAEGTGMGPSSKLIARYISGSRPGERVRMDRRTNDDVSQNFKPYYLHANLQSQIAMITDGDGKPVQTIAPSANEAGSSLAPPDEERFIAGSTTRTPYLSASLRIDGFSGIKYDEQVQRTIYDYRTSPTVANALNMAAYRRSITAMQNRGALALMVMTGAAVAPGAAVFEGLLNVGLNWTAAAWTSSPYTPSEAGEHLAQGAMSAGLGKLLPGGSSAMSRFWSDYASNVASGVAFDVGLHNASWSDAVTKNAISSFASAGIGSGIRLGFAGIGIGYKAVRNRLKSADAGSVEGFANQVGHGADAPYKPKDTGEVFASIVGGRGANRDIALQNETLGLLMNGGPYHKHIARQIMKGELTVHWDVNMPQKYGGLWHPDTPTAIYLNPWSFNAKPNSALSLAAVIVHEATHAMGGGELSAHIAQAQFIYGWWFGKGRRTTSFGSQRLQYRLSNADVSVTRAWQNTRLTNNPSWINRYLQAANYSPDKAFFIRAQHVNHLHIPIARAGGWGTVLNLHPDLDYKLFRFARNNNAVNF